MKDFSKRMDMSLVECFKEMENEDRPIHVIVKLKDGVHAQEISNYCTPKAGDRIDYRLERLDMMTGQFCKDSLKQLSLHSDIEKVYLDQPVKALLNVATPAIGGTAARNRFGLTGKGVTIAVVDTGIYPHPDLINPTNRIIGFADFINGRAQPYDDNGHGTHVAGDAASNGFSSSGLYRGPAPEANLVGVKVLDAEGGGSFSSVLSGIDFVIQNKQTFNIRIMNLSLGAIPTMSYLDCPLAQAVRKAWRNGIVVFAAAGNSGPTGTIQTPGFDPLIITVGAINDFNSVDRSDDVYANYTSRGPTVNGFIKPDLAAPGSNITSLISPNSTLANRFPGNRVGNQYFILSGTSMSTPLCAGACAQLLQAYPNLQPDRVKALLKETLLFFAENVPGYLIITRAIQLMQAP
jgi:serine protease AprX